MPTRYGACSMAQWQQWFGFFARLVLLSSGAGTIIAPQFIMNATEIKVAGQFLSAKVLAILGDIVGKDLMMNMLLVNLDKFGLASP